MTAREEAAQALSNAIADCHAQGGGIDCNAILAALSAAGWAVVPKEATEAMIAAARDPRTANGSPLSKGVAETWRAMIGAGGAVE